MNKNVVSEVNQILPVFQALFADLVKGNHRLDALSGSGLERRKAKLSGVAQEHHSTSKPNHVSGGDIRLEVWVVSLGRFNGVSNRE